MKWIYFVPVFILLASCGVKDKGAGPNPVTPVSGTPEGYYATKSKLFLVKPSTLDLKPHEENTVTYRFVTRDLTPVKLSDYTFRVTSNMPTMPEMGGPWDAADVKVLEDGQLSATYEIYHGHELHVWEFTIEVLSGDKVIDTLVYSHLVKE